MRYSPEPPVNAEADEVAAALAAVMMCLEEERSGPVPMARWALAGRLESQGLARAPRTFPGRWNGTGLYSVAFGRHGFEWR